MNDKSPAQTGGALFAFAVSRTLGHLSTTGVTGRLQTWMPNRSIVPLLGVVNDGTIMQGGLLTGQHAPNAGTGSGPSCRGRPPGLPFVALAILASFAPFFVRMLGCCLSQDCSTAHLRGVFLRATSDDLPGYRLDDGSQAGAIVHRSVTRVVND